MRFGVALAVVLAAGLLVAEAAMAPTGSERLQILSAFGGAAVLSFGVALALGRVTRRLASLRIALLVTALGALAAVASAVVVSATSMFLSAHDLRLVLIALALGLGLGLVLARAVASPLEQDIEALAETARRVAHGDWDATSGVERRDELGALAASIDAMVDQLAAADRERTQVDQARRNFLAAVGHDLRTPLTSLRAGLEALQDGVADDPDRYLRAMQADVALLGALVEDLFLLATIESGGLQLEISAVDVHELADETVEATHPLAVARRIDVRVLGDGPVMARADVRELRRILRHLLDNALRHSPDGSTVEVRLDRTGDHVQINVCDEGPGFDPEFLHIAFDRFTRADVARTREGGGAGLGLAIARALVEAQDGTIQAEPGPGGVVCVRLPAAPMPAPASRA